MSPTTLGNACQVRGCGEHAPSWTWTVEIEGVHGALEIDVQLCRRHEVELFGGSRTITGRSVDLQPRGAER